MEMAKAAGISLGRKRKNSDSGSEYDGVPLSPLEDLAADEEELHGSLPSLPQLPKSPGVLMSKDGDMVYFVGIIDVLQLYDCNKFSERVLKVYIQHKDKVCPSAPTVLHFSLCADCCLQHGVSVQPPMPYCRRFIEAAKNITTSKPQARLS